MYHTGSTIASTPTPLQRFLIAPHPKPYKQTAPPLKRLIYTIKILRLF